MSRFEWEKRYLLKKPKITATLWKGVIDKIRFEVKIGNHTYEVDEFYGANRLNCCWNWAWVWKWNFTKPNWLGIEVTNDNRYYNSNLSNNRLKIGANYFLKPQSLPSSLRCLYFAISMKAFWKINISGFYKRSSISNLYNNRLSIRLIRNS
jgi:hypothetical protein